jgi:MOSC domain-containing protein
MRVVSLHTYPVKGCYRIDQLRAEVQPWGLAGDRRWLIVDAGTGKAITQRDSVALTAIRPMPTTGGLLLAMPGRDELAVAEPEAGSVDLVEVTVWSFPGLAAPAGAEADDWLTAALERKVRLVWLDDPTRRPVDPEYARPDDRVSFADGYPLLLANTASLADLNDRIAEGGSLEGPLPMTRFRANVVIAGAAPWAEDAWTGGRVKIGEVTFRVPKRCDRCVVTTTDQETGERGREPLRTLARFRNVDQELLFGTNLIPDSLGEIAVGDPVVPT